MIRASEADDVGSPNPRPVALWRETSGGRTGQLLNRAANLSSDIDFLTSIEDTHLDVRQYHVPPTTRHSAVIMRRTSSRRAAQP